MTHHYVCSHCHHENKVSIKENDRGSFQMQNGDFLNTNCSKCLKTAKTHINDVYGKESRNMIIGGFVVGLLITVILLFIHPRVWLISLTFISIPTLVFVLENNSTKSFNQFRIKKK